MDANKWQVIQNWPQPKNVKELQSFLGSVNYLSKCIPHLFSFRKPLQDLLKSSNEFVWLKVHYEAFKILKNAITKDVTLKYFDSNLPIYIETDILKKGIGVVMLQPDTSVENTSHTEVPNNLRPVFYASKILTATESNYSNIEHEMLGVVFSMLHFKHFTYERETNVKFVPQVQNIPRVSKVLREEKIVSQPVPNTNKSTKPKTVTANKCSTVGSDAGSNNNCYKTRSGREVRKPPRYR